MANPLPAEYTRLLTALAEAHRLRPVETPVAFGDPLADFLLEDSDTPEPAIPVTDLGPTHPFADTIWARRSTRRLTAPTRDEIGVVLARSGLTRASGIDAAGAPVARRAAPSAGGRQPLTLVVVANDVVDLPSGAWVLDPDSALLRAAAYSPDAITSANHALADCLHADAPPPAAVFAVAHPDRTLSRYPDGISLLWKETGALLMLIHLVATDLGLGSCILGTCSTLHPPSSIGPVDLGSVAIGRAAAEATGGGT